MPRLPRGPSIQTFLGGVSFFVITFRCLSAEIINNTESRRSTPNSTAEHGTNLRNFDSSNVHSGYTDVPQVFRHHNDKKWGQPKAKKAGIVKEGLVQKKNKFKKFSTAEPGTNLRTFFVSNVHSGYTDVPQVFRHRNDKKWGHSRAKKARIVKEKLVQKKTKFEKFSTVKPSTLNGANLENVIPEKAQNVHATTLFENFNNKESVSRNLSESEQIYYRLRSYKIIPDVLRPKLTTMPLRHLQVTYGTNVVKYGTELYSLQIENEPAVMFKGEENTYYSLIAVGPDMPSYRDHDERNWLHWCVGNIPAGNVSRGGRVVTPYGGLALGYQLGPHRIVFLLYKQPTKKKIKFLESEFSDKLDFFRRAFYNPYVFMERYNLSGPVAANFMVGLWENEIHQAKSIFQEERN